MRWYTAFSYDTQAAVAWTPGVQDTESCEWSDVHLWTAGAHLPEGDIEVSLLDGETGLPFGAVSVQGLELHELGLAAAVADAAGDFWGVQRGQGSLVHVAREDFAVSLHPMPVGGDAITVDTQGRLLTCGAGVARFDPSLPAWNVLPGSWPATTGGCAVDSEGVLWVAVDDLLAIDTDRMTPVMSLALPERPRGVALDHQGHLWTATLYDNLFRIDPITADIATVNDLPDPTIRTDPTGFTLTQLLE